MKGLAVDEQTYKVRAETRRRAELHRFQLGDALRSAESTVTRLKEAWQQADDEVKVAGELEREAYERLHGTEGK